MPLDFDAVSRETRAKGRGDQRKGHCPSHDDKNPSLSITREPDGTALVRCHAGCDQRAVFKALIDKGCGVDDSAHRNGARLSGAGLLEGKYLRIHDYTDENGALLYQVCVTPDKQHIQRRPDGRGGHIYDTKGVRRVLYKLPALLAGIARGKTVLIVEGEKHADRLIKEGFVATTFSGGAGALKTKNQPKDWPQLFRDVPVCMLGDNDAPGKAHACRVCRALRGIAKSIRVIKVLPGVGDHGDVLNWLGGENDAKALQALIRATPEYEPEPGDDTEAHYANEDTNAAAAGVLATDASDDDGPSSAEVPTLDPAAYHGPLGKLVRLIEPHTEAAPVAVLVSMLVALGALIGRAAHFMVERQRHGVNLFALLIGHTSDGRKGTAFGYARDLLYQLDASFLVQNVKSGLSSGQGLIHYVRDPEPERPRAPDTDGAKGRDRERDPGVLDKRLLVSESEFANVLRLKRGQENILSGVMRDTWDGNSLGTLTKHHAETATDPHVAIVGQITPAELRACLENEDYTNGFLNRFLFVHTERTRILPFAGDPDPAMLAQVWRSLSRAITSARLQTLPLQMSPAARTLWTTEYVALSTGYPGRLGEITNRAAPMVRRLALLYALLDDAHEITVDHLLAALSVWRYSVASARYVFGDGISARCLRVLEAMREADFFLRSDIRKVGFGSNNVPAEQFNVLLGELRDSGQTRITQERTAGRSREEWRHITKALPLTNTPMGKMGEMGEKRESEALPSHKSHFSHSVSAEIVLPPSEPATAALHAGIASMVL